MTRCRKKAKLFANKHIKKRALANMKFIEKK